MTTSQAETLDTIEPIISLSSALWLLAAVSVGALAAVFVVPNWLPGLSESILSSDPKVYWYLARTSGIVAYLLLWFATVFGLILSNKVARVWPGGPMAVELHQFTSLLGLAFALFHALILLGDRYIRFSLLQILIPFTSINYAPFAVGLGQLAFYLLVPVTFSFYVRRHIGPNTWRSLHYASFIGFAFVVVHGLLAGTDTQTFALLGLYAVTGGFVFFLTLYRVCTMSAAHA